MHSIYNHTNPVGSYSYSYVGKKMPQAASKATKLKKTTSGDLPMLVVVRIVLLMASPWSTNGILKRRRRGTQKRRRGMYEYEFKYMCRLVVYSSTWHYNPH